jgi:DNA repair exonuclease SbcCD ATPase subunit
MLLDPVLIAQAMEVMRSSLPELHERLEAFRRHDPERFELAMRKVLPVVREYIDLRDRNPDVAQTIIEEFRIEERLRELSRTYTRAAEENLQELAEIEGEIERLVHKQFKLRFRRRAARLEEFERRLMKQRERLERQRIRLQEEMQRLEELVAKRVADVKKGKVQDRPRRGGLRHKGPEDEFEGRRPRGPRGERRRPHRGPDDEDRPAPRHPDRRDRRPLPPEEPEGY